LLGFLINDEIKMHAIRKLIIMQSSVRQLCATASTGDRIKSLGFIGFGKIAQAMSLGLINKNLLSADQIYASDKFICHLENIKASSSFKASVFFLLFDLLR
jgi:hypothetical protein